MVIEYVILIKSYYQTAQPTALYECIDGHVGQPKENIHNSNGWGDYYRTVPELMVRV
jgi:hypothetical protein